MGNAAAACWRIWRKGRMRAAGKLADLSMALAGRFTEHHALLCRLHRDRIGVFDSAVADLDQRIAGKAALAARGRAAQDHLRLGGRGDLGVARRDPPRAAPALLRPRQARLLSEPVPGQQHQRPQAQERPDRRRWDLHQASADPGRMGRDPGPGPDRLQARYNRLVRRFGEDKNPAARKKAITAIAHTLLKIAYQVLKSGTPYQEPGTDSTPGGNHPPSARNSLRPG